MGSAGGGEGFEVEAESCEVFGGEVLAVVEDGGDGAGVTDVGEGVLVEEDEIGEVAGGDGAEVGLAVEEEGGVEGGGLEGLERGEAGGDEALELVVEAGAGDDVDAGGGVGAGEEGDAGELEAVDDAELVLDEVLADGDRVGVEGGGDAFSAWRARG